MRSSDSGYAKGVIVPFKFFLIPIRDSQVAENEMNLQEAAATIKAVDHLSDRFRQEISLSDKLLRGFKFLGGVATAALPHARLLLSMAYAVLGAWVVLSGADYVDSRRFRLLNRVDGVRTLVRSGLSAA